MASAAPLSPGAVVVRAGLATAVCDFLWACALSIGVYKGTFASLWQGVASVLLGKSAVGGGTLPIVVGILMHFLVAFSWADGMVWVVRKQPRVRALLLQPFGALIIAAVLGPLIWATMSLLIIPIFTHRFPDITPRWFIQALGHVAFVALPMTATIRHWMPRASPAPATVA